MANMEVNFDQLKTAISWSERQLEAHRRNRLAAIKEYVGKHYSDNGNANRVPTNFLELAVTIYTQQLAARPPRVMVSTNVPQLRPYALTQELALNELPEELDLGGTMRRSVIEALFGMAVVKVGLASSSVYVDGYDVGEPFVELITPDDYFLDMSAKSRRALQYEGNTYWLPLDDARDMWEGKSKYLQPDAHTVVGEEGNTRAESVGSDGAADMYKDKVMMRDVWIPSKQKIITYAVTSSKVMNIVDWDGPEKGPYHSLYFSEVPGNLMPLPPVALWRDLHELGNSLFRKLGKQADVKKTVAAFPGGNDDDVANLKSATDGEGIKYSGQPPTNITVGGIDAPTLAFFLQTRDLFSYYAGNLDTLGGLSPMTETAGQDRLLTEAASARMQYMSKQVLDFAKGIFKALAWYEWTDPVRERVVVKTVPGEKSLSIPVKWSKDTREGDFLDYNFDIDVHSMEDNTPSTKLQKLSQIMERFILPMLPQLQAQGIDVSFKSLLELVSKWSDMPEVMDVLMLTEPYQGDPMRGNPMPEGTAGKPAHTTRTYERVNRPGATRHGKDDVLTRVLMGAGVQQTELAAVGRPNT